MVITSENFMMIQRQGISGRKSKGQIRKGGQNQGWYLVKHVQKLIRSGEACKREGENIKSSLLGWQ